MNWGSWSAFWSMGGYAWYVWGSYGVTIVALLLEIVALRQRRWRALLSVARVRAGSGGPRP